MKDILIVIGIIIALTVTSTVLYTCNKVRENTTDKAFISYEDYQEIYNTCQKINSDLCNLKDMPESDKMFEQFSKTQRQVGLRNTMNRWIEEYNAKSKMWNKSMWKSKQLPYQLTSDNFSCY